MTAPSPSYVYFLRPVGAIGPIKIGFSRDPIARLRSLLAWSPVPLEVIVSVSAPKGAEPWAHKKFASCRLHSEWFAATPELLAFVTYAERTGTLDGFLAPLAVPEDLFERLPYPLGNLLPFLKSRGIPLRDLAAEMSYAPSGIRLWATWHDCSGAAYAAACALARLGIACTPSDLAKRQEAAWPSSTSLSNSGSPSLSRRCSISAPSRSSAAIRHDDASPCRSSPLYPGRCLTGGAAMSLPPVFSLSRLGWSESTSRKPWVVSVPIISRKGRAKCRKYHAGFPLAA